YRSSMPELSNSHQTVPEQHRLELSEQVQTNLSVEPKQPGPEQLDQVEPEVPNELESIEPEPIESKQLQQLETKQPVDQVEPQELVDTEESSSRVDPEPEIIAERQLSSP